MKIITHKPVMIKEAIDALNVRKNYLYIDATFGLGGFSKKILEAHGGIENNNIDGFSWNVENGEYYAGLGQKNSNGPGTVDVYYDVKLRISGLVAVVLIGLSGACFGYAFTRE